MVNKIAGETALKASNSNKVNWSTNLHDNLKHVLISIDHCVGSDFSDYLELAGSHLTLSHQL